MKANTNKQILSLISGLALATAPGHAQMNGPLLILWQATYGPGLDKDGVGDALAYDFVQTADGGFLIAGSVLGSTNEFRTLPICENADGWVIKIDSQGRRQWDKSYGGDITWSPGDFCLRLFLQADGGFLLAGFSASETGCLKTAPLPGGINSFWVVRCDASGQALWDRSFLPEDHGFVHPSDYEVTADGGYLGCGFGGDPNGTSGNYGIIKFDGQGQQLWAKTFGCTSANTYSWPLRIRETADGGFIVAGHSSAPPCADKTSLYYGGAVEDNPWLGSDFWVVRFDAQGNKLWDKSYGGASTELALDIQPVAGGGFLVVGGSRSLPVTDPTKGTKTSPRYGNFDFWVVRIDDQGNPLWDRSYGGVTGSDVCTHAEPMPDGGWLLSGTSASVPGGNKTSPRFGSFDFWLVRIDDQGNKLWDQSFGGTKLEGKDWLTASPPAFLRERIKRTADGGFLLTGFSMSPVGGTKTAPLISQGDLWVLKLGPEPPCLRSEMTADGQCKLCLIAPPEFQHTLQGSADLVTWTDLATPPNPTGKTYWTDPDKLAQRFYRAVRK